MKKIIILSSIFIGLLSFTSSHVDSYTIDTAKSNVKWIGSKVTGSHDGYISFSEGKIMMDHGKLVSADFVIDMNSITNTDIEDKKYSQKLVDHLKNEDFFDVANYPKATFKLIRASQNTDGSYKVSGELTIKKFKDVVNFNMNATTRGNSFVADGKFTFDRTKFDIIYGSGTFFDNLGDKAINNDVELSFSIVSNK
jgi:polyisoprenoid-binding protein YceI